MNLRSKIIVGITLVAGIAILVMNGGRHLTHDQVVGWFR
jgi:hypothetical protein